MTGVDGNFWPLARFVVVCTLRGGVVGQYGSRLAAIRATGPTRVAVDRKTAKIIDPWH